MSKRLSTVTILGLILFSSNVFAYSISTKTTMKNGLRTQVCINSICKTFEGAMGAAVTKQSTEDRTILEVHYLSSTKRLFDWEQETFLELEAK